MRLRVGRGEWEFGFRFTLHFLTESSFDIFDRISVESQQSICEIANPRHHQLHRRERQRHNDRANRSKLRSH